MPFKPSLLCCLLGVETIVRTRLLKEVDFLAFTSESPRSVQVIVQVTAFNLGSPISILSALLHCAFSLRCGIRHAVVICMVQYRRIQIHFHGKKKAQMIFGTSILYSSPNISKVYEKSSVETHGIGVLIFQQPLFIKLDLFLSKNWYKLPKSRIEWSSIDKSCRRDF